MRIWLATGNMNAGGAESLIMEILRNKPDDVLVEMLIHSAGDDYSGVYDEEIRKLGIRILNLPSVGSVGITKYTKKFEDLVSQNGKPDIIHIHLNAVSGIIARAAKKNGILCRIIHGHANITYTGSRIYVLRKEIELKILKCFVNHYGTHFWACSGAAAKRLFYKGNEYVIIPNMIDTRRFLPNEAKRKMVREEMGFDDSVWLVGAVGRIAPIKNYEVIIKALASVKNNDRIKCVIYGRIQDTSYMDYLKEIVRKNNVEEKVLFMGNSEKIADALASFDVFVMPSHSEGLPVAAVEAQAAGLQVFLSTGVSDETTIIPELVHRIEPDKIEQWADAIVVHEISKITCGRIMDAFEQRNFDSKTGCTEIYKLYEQYQRQHKK